MGTHREELLHGLLLHVLHPDRPLPPLRQAPVGEHAGEDVGSAEKKVIVVGNSSVLKTGVFKNLEASMNLWHLNLLPPQAIVTSLWRLVVESSLEKDESSFCWPDLRFKRNSYLSIFFSVFEGKGRLNVYTILLPECPE